jgi:hypothetical protein
MVALPDPACEKYDRAMNRVADIPPRGGEPGLAPTCALIAARSVLHPTYCPGPLRASRALAPTLRRMSARGLAVQAESGLKEAIAEQIVS